MSYRPLGQFPQYFLDNGNLNAGGFVYTYENDLTTPKLTYSDEALTVPNSNPILLDSSGRPSTDVWGDGAFGMEIADADDVVYLTANNIQPDTGSTQTIPALETGEFLTNDGSNLLWEPVAQVPDPSGFADYILSTDGSNFLWIPQPEVDIPEPDIVITTSPNKSLRVGTTASTTKVLKQYGSGSAPASGNKQTTLAVVFPTAYNVLWMVNIMPTGGPFAPGNGAGGYYADWALSANSTTGFTVLFNTNHGEENSDGNITSPIDFLWEATGTVIVT